MRELQLRSSVFAHEEAIPRKYTCDGMNIAPPLEWSGVPENAKSLVLIVNDPDAPAGDWVHWVLYNLAPQMDSLPENVEQKQTTSTGARQGVNDFQKIGYGGPCPPSGTPHRYFFTLYALDIDSNWEPGLDREEVLLKTEGHVIARGQLMGTYQRQR